MLSVVRGIHGGDWLLASSGKWPSVLHRKALHGTWPPRMILGAGSNPNQGAPAASLRSGVAGGRQQRNLWVQAGGLGAGKGVPVVPRSQKGGASPSAAQKVKEAGRDFTYLIVVVVGIGVTGGLFYVVFKELFSSSSPSKIYGDALEKCRAHPEVIGFFGEPIKGYGEATRRGRRQLVSHIEYVKDGLKYMRLKFYIEGSEKGKQGTVHLEVKQNPDSGKYEYRYIFVNIDDYPRRTIIIEDNR